MKKIILILSACTLGIGCVKSQSGAVGMIRNVVSPLIVISGESNAGGQSVNADLTVPELAPRQSVKILNNYTFGFETLDIGTNNTLLHQGIVDNSTHGVEDGLANSCDSGILGQKIDLTAIPIYIVKAGTGTARLYWFNDSTFMFQSANAWQQLKLRMDTAIKLLTTINKGTPPPIYFVWFQGINDHADGRDATLWKDSTKMFITNKLRARYGTMPVFMPYLPVTDAGAFNPYITTMATELVQFYPIATSDAPLKDSKHWDSAGMKLIASRIIAALKAHYTYQ